MAEKTTKMEVTSMTLIENEANPRLKALATVALNDEFVIKGVKVVAGENGLFASMPSRSFKGEYSDIIFPITAEAREQLNNTVIDAFAELTQSGEQTLYNPVDTPEKSVSDITVSLHGIENGGKTKAAGQIVIDDNFVITGVKVVEGKEQKNFVQMPSYQTQTGEYAQYANAITTDMHEKIQDKVLSSYEKLPVYKGVRFAELGDKENVAQYFKQNNSFADKLMNQLDMVGIAYHARIAENTTISVKSEDKGAVDKIRENLTAALKAEREGGSKEKPSVMEGLSKAKEESKARQNERPPKAQNKSRAQEL